MFDTLFWFTSTSERHRSGPFAAERERYLLHGKAVGATDLTQQQRARVLLRVAQEMSPDDRQGVDIQRLRSIIEALRPRTTAAIAAQLINVARPWFKFLGWWQEAKPPVAFLDELDAFVRWMRDERGLAPSTIHQWRDRTAVFLQWCSQNGRSLAVLKPEDIDAYFVSNQGNWSRTSVRNIANMLRTFLRHAEARGAAKRDWLTRSSSHVSTVWTRFHLLSNGRMCAN